MPYFKLLLLSFGIACTYFLLALLGLFLSPSHAIGSTFYPASGFALGVLLAYERKGILGVFLGIASTIIWLKLGPEGIPSEELASVSYLVLAIFIQAAIGCAFLKKFKSIQSSFVNHRLTLFLRFLLAMVFSTLVGSLLAVGSLVWTGDVSNNNFIPSWLRWWTGDMLGIVFFTPITLTLLTKSSGKASAIKRLCLPLLAGTAIISALSYKVHYDQEAQTREVVDQKLEKYQAMLLHQLIRVEERVRSISRFYESSLYVSEKEFQQFARSADNNMLFTNGYSWNALLLPEQVTVFERNMAQELGDPDFKLRELASNWPAEQQPDWKVAVERIYPSSQKKSVLGLNIMSEFQRGRTVLEAISSKSMRATPPIQLVQSGEKVEQSVLIFAPVYKIKHSVIYLGEHLPDGFAVGVVNLTNLIRSIFPEPRMNGTSIKVTDITDDQQELIYHSRDEVHEADGQLEQHIDFNFLNRTIRLQVTHSKALCNELASEYDLWLSFFSLLFGSALVYFLFANNFNQARIEKEVYDKTELLNQIRRIQNTYIKKGNFDETVLDLLNALEEFTHADASIVVLRNPNENFSTEFISTRFGKTLSPKLRLLEHFVTQYMHEAVTLRQVQSHPFFDLDNRSVIVIPWTNGQQERAIVLSVNTHKVQPPLISQLELIRESLESTTKAILESEVGSNALVQLKENSELLSQAESIGNAGTWKINHKTLAHHFSRNAFNILGVKEEDHLSIEQLFDSLVHPADKAALRKSYESSLNSGLRIYETQHRILYGPEKSLRYVRERFEHVFESGQLMSTKGIIYDVTDSILEAKRLEEEAGREQRQREAITSLTFNLLSPGSGLKSKLESIIHKASQVLHVSRAGLWLFNEDRTQLYCAAFAEGGIAKKLLPEPLIASEYPIYFQSLIDTARIQVVDTAEDDRVEELYEGYLKPLKIQAMLDVSITRDGEMIGVLCLEHIGNKRDWSTDEALFANTLAVLAAQTLESHERSEFAAKLLKEEKDREMILNAMTDSVLTIDQKGKILSANQATTRNFEYERDELIGQSVNILMPPEVAAHHDAYVGNYVSSKQAKVIGIGRVVTGMKKSGEHFPVRLSVAELTSADSGESIFVGTLHDMTLEVKQQEQIQRTQKMDALGQLTGGIAHDFNNILGIMLGYSEMLIEFLPEEQGHLIDYAKQIEIAGERARTLIQKLRAFSKKDKGTTKLLNLNEVLDNQKLMLEKAVTSKNQLVFDFEPTLKQSNLDESDLENGILNLCVNAMHAMPDSGSITITTRNQEVNFELAQELGISPGEYVFLSVSDEGQGMPQSVMERIFEPFYSTKGDKGTGLGLSSLYGFVQRSLGAITVDSKLGSGTTFCMYFPIESGKPDKQLKVHSPVLIEQMPQNNDAILIVDDEASLRNMLSDRLSQRGYTVLTAEHGLQALELLQAHSVSLLLSDIIMPEMDGIALCNEVEKRYPELKVQLMSGFSDDHHSQLNNYQLYEDRLVKPFNFEDLLKRIKHLLQK